MKRILTLASLLAVFCGCSHEMPVQEEYTPRLRSVSIRLESAGTDTKSVISVEAEDFRRAYLFAFDAATKKVFLDEAGRSIAVKTESKTVDWSIPAGPDGAGNDQVMDVYAIVNPDAENAALLDGLLSRTDVTESQLEALTYVCADALSLHSLETGGIPMSGCLKGISLASADEPFVLSIKRLYARYDIRLDVSDFAAADWTVEAAEVSASQANTRAPYFYTGTGVGVRADVEDLAMIDFATESDIAALNTFGADHKSTAAVTLYLLENCQGDIGPASRWDKVAEELGSSVDACTYVDFGLTATHPEKGRRSFRFRFYPGSGDDMCSNFDIVRNSYRKVSLRPRLEGTATEGFRFIGADGFKVAPGEAKTIRYETSLAESEIVFQRFFQGAPTTDFEVAGVTWSTGNASDPSHSTEYPNYGFLSVRAASGAHLGSGYELCGGNASGDISDRIGFTITDDGSFWKDVEVLRRPDYRGQWMVVQLPESVFGAGTRLEASVCNRVLQNDGSYQTDGQSVLAETITPGSDVFGNGQIDIRKPHIWYDHNTKLLFVYSHIPQFKKTNYSVLNLRVVDGTGSGEYTLCEKDFEFTLKEPLLRMAGYLDRTDIIGKSTVTTEGITWTDMDGFYFTLVDPDSLRPIDNREFEWGGDNLGHGMGGRTYAPWKCTTRGFYRDNFFIEGRIEYDINESDIEDCFDLSLDNWPDEGSYDFNVYNCVIRPHDDTGDFPYDDGMHINFWHTFFNSSQVSLTPTCQQIAAPRRELHIMEAQAGTNDYAAMRCSNTEATQDAYLMYGFKKTYFVRLDNLNDGAAPSVSLSHSSSATPYLQYSLTATGTGLWRLDLRVDRYEDPRSADETQLPYPAGNTWLDESARDKAVTVTVSKTYNGNTYSDKIICNVLHKRFDVELRSLGRKGLSVKMWNPLGFIASANVTAHATLERYWYKNPMAEVIDGKPNIETVAGAIYAGTADLSAPLSADFSASITSLEGASRGIRCEYARDVHPSFTALPATEDLILYYPGAQVKSLYIDTDVSASGFSSSVPGLSLDGISFNILNFITFGGNLLAFDYTHSTLSEYYLQALFYEEYNSDKWYYNYRFVTPTHWSANNPQAPFTFTNDNPMHIGGNDFARSIQATARFGREQSRESYEKGNPTVKY